MPCIQSSEDDRESVKGKKAWSSINLNLKSFFGNNELSGKNVALINKN